MLLEMQEPKHIKHKYTKSRPSPPKPAQARAKACASTRKHCEQLLGTYGNLLNLKKREIFDFKKTSYRRRKKKKEEQSSL